MVALQGQVAEMNKLLQSMTLSQVNIVMSSVYAAQQVSDLGYVGCEGPHNNDVCPLNTKTIAYEKNDPYSNTYNAGWREHLNFSLGGQEQNNQRRQGGWSSKLSCEAPSYRQGYYIDNHTIQHLTISKPPPLLHSHPPLWRPFFVNTCKGMCPSTIPNHIYQESGITIKVVGQ